MVKLVALTLAVCAVSLVVSFPANNFGLRYHSSKHEESRDSWSHVIPYRGRGGISESRQAKLESSEESAEDSAESVAYSSPRKTAPVVPVFPADVSDEALNELVPGGQVTKDLPNQIAAQQESQLQADINQSVQTGAIAVVAEPVQEQAVEQPSEPSKDAPLPVAEVETLTQVDDKVTPELVDQVFIQETPQDSNLPEAADDARSVIAEAGTLTQSESNIAAEQADQSSNQEAAQQKSSSLPEAADSQVVPVEAAETVAAEPETIEQNSSADIAGEPVEEAADPAVVRIIDPVVILPLSDELRESLQSVPSQDEPNAEAAQSTFDDAAATGSTEAAADETHPVAVDDPSQGQVEDVTELIQAKPAGIFNAVNEASEKETVDEEAQVEQDTVQPDLARDVAVTEVNDVQDSTELPADVDVNARNALSVLSEESHTEVVSDSTEVAPQAQERQEMFNYHKGPVETESTTVTLVEDEHTQFEASADDLAARNSAAAEQGPDSTAQSENVLKDVETATDLLQDEATDSPVTELAARSALAAIEEIQAADATIAAADDETTTEST